MMAEAIIRGLLDKAVVPPTAIAVSEPVPARRAYLSSKLGLFTTDSPAEMLARSSTVFLAVKPDIISLILRDITADENAGGPSRLYVSIAAGVTLDTLTEGRPRRVARVMPNQPAVVGQAASAISLSDACTPADTNTVTKLLGAIGLAVTLPEKSLDAVTGLSGSGPAFVFMMIEAMADAGVKNGLSRPVAARLAAQTVYGAARMVLDDPDVHPAVLRNRVESPGGTTIAGSSTLEEAGFRTAIIKAVTAAAERATELGKK